MLVLDDRTCKGNRIIAVVPTLVIFITSFVGLRTVEGNEDIPSNLYNNVSENKITGSSLFVENPSGSCSNNSNCYPSMHDVACINGQCRCIDSCWIYSYSVQGLWSYIEYECGPCGILGSECNLSLPCEEPGHCDHDGFCHCPIGENHEQICLVFESNMFTSFLLGSFLVFLILGTTIAGYNAYLGYQIYGTWCWCRYINCSRRHSQNTSRQYGPPKSPAYTVQLQQNRNRLTSRYCQHSTTTESSEHTTMTSLPSYITNEEPSSSLVEDFHNWDSEERNAFILASHNSSSNGNTSSDYTLQILNPHSD